MIGQTISHYKIISRLGGGGMGVVYKAEDTKLKRTVALKFLPPELVRDEDAKERFVHEARAASALEHPNICTIHEIDEIPPEPGVPGDSQIFICMAYYEGETLKKKIKHGPIPWKEAVQIAISVAKGLKCAHQAGIIHRDIKPANIMVAPDGEARIVDFGLAKLAGQTTRTKPGQTPGTVAYMSPEQVRGDPIDHRTDIWSFGVLLYEMLSGQLPFKGEYEQAVLYSILQEEPDTLLYHHLEIPRPLIKIIDKCLVKDIRRRYSDIQSVLNDLEAVGRVSVVPKPTIYFYQVGQWIKDRKYQVLLASLVLLLLFIFSPTPRWLGNILGFRKIPPVTHLAVLPCANIGDQPANQVFCDGLCETLTSKLTQLQEFQGNLWVVPFSDTRVLENASVGEARKQFGINLAVTSSFQRQGDNIRFTMNLVDAESMRQSSSRIIDTNFYNIAVLPDSILNLLTEMLGITVKPEKEIQLTNGQSQNPRVNEIYIQGRGYLLNYENIVNLHQAASLFREAISRDPYFTLAYAGLGEAFWQTYRMDKNPQWLDSAIAYSNLAVQQNATIPGVQVLKGNIQLETGSATEAMQSFQNALDLDSLSSDAYRGLARAYERQKSNDKAERTYLKAIQIKPTYWACYNQLGAFYFRQGRYEEAATQFKKVVQLVPENIRGYSNLGAIYFYLERWEDARKIFEKSLLIKPTYQAYSNLGTLYFYENQFKNAAEMFQQALEISDQDYTTWGHLGEAYYWIPGQSDQTRKHFTTAISLCKKKLEIDPENLELLSDLAGYHVRIGNTKTADSLLTKIIARNPQENRALFKISDCYEQMGSREQALHWMQRALAGGYSLAEIRRNPGLKELVADPRFKNILPENSPQ